MARIKGALSAALALTVLLAPATPAYSTPSDTSSRRYWAPVIADGRTFPVLLSVDGRWLNWRDTYGAPRMRLINGTWKQVGIHEGVDIYSERSTPVVAMTAGTVENIGWTFYSGYRVGVRGSDGNYYFYAHMLPDFASGIVKGATVQPGRRLGYIGSSGYGPEPTMDEFPAHLHFGLQVGKRWVDSNETLEALFALSVADINSTRSERLILKNLSGAISSRISGPAAPPLEVLDVVLSRTAIRVVALDQKSQLG